MAKRWPTEAEFEARMEKYLAKQRQKREQAKAICAAALGQSNYAEA